MSLSTRDAVAHDVEQLDRGLRVEQAADVLGDLGDVLDDEEADLVRHRPDSTTQARAACRPDGPMRPSGRVTRRTGASGPAGDHDDRPIVWGPSGSRS